MKDDWELVFHQQAFDVIATARGRQKKYLSRALEALLAHPYRTPDYQEKDKTGRSLSVLLAGPWAITFWLDHFVKEIRIVSVEKVGS